MRDAHYHVGSSTKYLITQFVDDTIPYPLYSQDTITLTFTTLCDNKINAGLRISIYQKNLRICVGVGVQAERKSENRCHHCSLFRVSFTVLSLKNLYSLCKNEVPFGVSVNQQIFIKTNQ